MPDESKGGNAGGGWRNLALPPTPSPRRRGEGWGEGVLNLKIIGLLTPPFSSFWEEREKNGSSIKVRPR
jgi:hypothetical protein